MEPTEAQPNGDSWFGNILNQNSREAFASFHCPGKKVGRCVDRHGPWMLTGLDVQFVNQDGEYQLLTGNQRFHHASPTFLEAHQTKQEPYQNMLLRSKINCSHSPTLSCYKIAESYGADMINVCKHWFPVDC